MLADEAIALGARDKIAALGIPNLTVSADRGTPTDDKGLPVCDVFVGMDDATPDGDPRTGIIGYVHKITMAIEITARGNSVREAKAWLAAAGEAILDALFTDMTWAKRDGQPIIEGFGALRRGYLAPPEGNHLIVKLQIEMQVLARSVFAPDAAVLPDFSALGVGLDLGSGDDAPVFGAEIPVPTA